MNTSIIVSEKDFNDNLRHALRVNSVKIEFENVDEGVKLSIKTRQKLAARILNRYIDFGESSAETELGLTNPSNE